MTRSDIDRWQEFGFDVGVVGSGPWQYAKGGNKHSLSRFLDSGI